MVEISKKSLRCVVGSIQYTSGKDYMSLFQEGRCSKEKLVEVIVEHIVNNLKDIGGIVIKE